MSIGGSFDVVDSYLPLSQLGAGIVDPRNLTGRGHYRRFDRGEALRIIGPVFNEFKWNIAVGAVP